VSRLALGALALFLSAGPAYAHVGEHASVAAVLQADLRYRAHTGETSKLAAGLAALPARAHPSVIVEPAHRIAAAQRAIASVGGHVDYTGAGLVQAHVPARALLRLSRAAAVRYVSAPVRPVQLGVVDEGVATTNAPAWHALGLNGTGAKVAIIDDGFRGFATKQAAGEISANATAVDMCDGGIQYEPHGAAIAEIVSKEAPGAQIFMLCVDSLVTLGAAEQYAKEHGANVISMSLGWYGTWSGDGHGPAGTPDAVVADARKAGILWVNAAGNDALSHWSGRYADGNGDNLADLGPAGDPTDSFALRGGSAVCIFMRWNEWPSATHDYDLVLVREPSRLTLAVAGTNQHLLHNEPAEQLCFQNPSFGTLQVGLVVTAPYGSDDPQPYIDIFAEGFPYNLQLEHRTAVGSISDPAASPNVLAVGAICWQETAVEFYSSQGPTVDGRLKPDIVAPDSVSTATYGPFSGSCGFTGFSGTSASAPHVAGAAALVKQRYPSFKATQLEAYLLAHAGDLGTPGPDQIFGAGRLLLPAIVAPAVGTLSASRLHTHDARIQIPVTTAESDTQVTLEYGRTPAYGAKLSGGTVSGTKKAGNAVAVLRKLRPNTTYHVRAIVTSIGGTATSSDLRFRTARR
jgi:subtilisin family serine protease